MSTERQFLPLDKIGLIMQPIFLRVIHALQQLDALGMHNMDMVNITCLFKALNMELEMWQEL